MTVLKRRASKSVLSALAVARVVLLHGPRQSGKSTLGRMLEQKRGMDYVTFDEAAQLAAARADPSTFLATRRRPLVIDEIQRAGTELLLAIKADVDRSEDRGRYLVMGSTNFLTIPSLAESLTGRIRIVRLWPFSFGERLGGADGFVDRAFGGPELLLAHKAAVLERDTYLKLACEGGFPGAQGLRQRDRDHWFADYLDTVIQREIATAGDIRNVSGLRKLAQYLAANSSHELVIARITSDLGLDRATVESYIAWLETAFLVHRVPAWGRSLTTKVVKRPKIFVTDSGICAAMMGKSPDSLRALTEPATGPVMETLVVNELAKQITWSEVSAELAHMRDATGREVDTILEARDGRVVAIEVKSSSTPRLDDFRWLRDLRDRMDHAGGRFVCGVVLHTGKDRLPFGDRLVALPIRDLWG